MTKPDPMTKILLGAALALALGGATAARAIEKGDTLGTDDATIRGALQAQGYKVGKIDMDDDSDGDNYEAKATKDGTEWEIKIDPETGQVLSIAHDD